MVVYTGYCRPLKRKVEFSVKEVNPVETKRGIKWAVKGTYENHNISTFASKTDAQLLLSQMDSKDVEVFGAEIAYEEPKGKVKTMTGKPHTPRTLKEDKDITPKEARTKTQLRAENPYADLDPKYMTKDGKPDMRFKICRDINAKMMSAESFEASINTIKVYDIDWDTDGEDVDLPSSVSVPADLSEDEIADWLSNEYGWLVNGFVRDNEPFESETVEAETVEAETVEAETVEEFNLEEFMAELQGYEKANSTKIKIRLLNMIQEINDNRLPHFSYKLEPTDEELHSIEDINYDDISGTLKIYTTTNDDAKSNKEDILRQFNVEFKKGLMDLEQCIVIIEGLEGYFTGQEKWSENADDDFYYCPKDLKDAENEYFKQIVHEVFEDYMDSKDKDTLKFIKENNFRVGLLETESGELYDLSHELKMITDEDDDEPMFAFILTPNQNGEKTNLLDFYDYYRAWDEKSEEDEEEFFYKGLKMDFSPLNPEVGLVTIDMYDDDDEYTFQIDFDKKLIFFKGSFNEIEDDDDYDEDEDDEGDDTQGITYDELADFVYELTEDGFGHLPVKIGVWDRDDEDQYDENYVIGNEILYDDGMVYVDDLDNDPLISAIPLESEESFDAETYQKVYTAEPDMIIWEEHIPPEIWNRMGPDQKGTYITTRDESMLVSPCCGVSKAEIRENPNANEDCDSCCWMGDNFHPRWWADKPAPKVTMQAEDFKMDSQTGNTATVPASIYYKMMLQIPDSVSAEKTDDGLSVILGFHDQDVDYMDFLLDTYNPQAEDDSLVQGGEGFEAETYATDSVLQFNAPQGISIRDTERYESESFYSTSLENYYANVFKGSDNDSATTDFNGNVLISQNPDAFESDDISKYAEDSYCVMCGNISIADYEGKELCKECYIMHFYDAESLQEWGNQEMMTHGKDISFNEWLNDEVEKHGDVDFSDWAEHEEESHEDRYGAESFEGESKPESYMVGSDVHELSKASDKLEELADASKKYPEWWKSRLSVTADEADGLADYLEYAEDSGTLDRLQAEEFRARMTQYKTPKGRKMIWGLLGIGVGTALLAPNQIRELINKYRK